MTWGKCHVVIYAAAKFRCRHCYIATAEHERLLFVCSQCHHRTELLCLDRRATLRGVVAFAPQNAADVDNATSEKWSA